MVSTIVADMDNLIKERNATITYEGLPAVTAYETDLRQLFQNLIANGIKFSKPDVAPQINVSVTKQKTSTLLP